MWPKPDIILYGRFRPTAVTGKNGKLSLAGNAERGKAAARNAESIFSFGRRQCSDCGQWPGLDVLPHPAMTVYWRFFSKPVAGPVQSPASRHFHSTPATPTMGSAAIP